MIIIIISTWEKSFIIQQKSYFLRPLSNIIHLKKSKETFFPEDSSDNPTGSCSTVSCFSGCLNSPPSLSSKSTILVSIWSSSPVVYIWPILLDKAQCPKAERPNCLLLHSDHDHDQHYVFLSALCFQVYDHPKGCLTHPKRINFRKSPKRPFTPSPIIFGNSYYNFFPKFMTEVSSIMAKNFSKNVSVSMC